LGIPICFSGYSIISGLKNYSNYSRCLLNQHLCQACQWIEFIAQHLNLPICHIACYCCHWHFLLHQRGHSIHNMAKFSYLFRCHCYIVYILSEMSPCSYKTSSITCIFLLEPTILFTQNPGQVSSNHYLPVTLWIRWSRKHNIQICVADWHTCIYSGVAGNMHYV
jgi:hypothetical protein